MPDLTPSVSVAIKLASAIVHAEEYMSPSGHPVDRDTFERLMLDPEVGAYMQALADNALLPVKR